MSKLHEVINSLSDETDLAEVKQQLLAEADTLDENNKQLFSRAKKAEGFEYNEDTKEWLKKEPKPEVKLEKPEAKLEPNEPDYSKLAFLEGRGYKHPDDQKYITDEATRLKKHLTDTLSEEHVLNRLKNASDQRQAQAGTPSGGGGGGGDTRSDVAFWMDKRNDDGTFASPEDPELHSKVIDARMAKEKGANEFAPIR